MKKNWVFKLALLLFLALALDLSVFEGYAEASAVDVSVSQAVYYLSQQQQDDGNLGSDWVALGLVAAGEDILSQEWTKNGKNHLDSVADAVYQWDLTKDTSPPFPATTTVARTLMTVARAVYGHGGGGYTLENFQGYNLMALLKSRQDLANGHFGNGKYISWGWPTDESTFVNAHVWSILALDAAGEGIPQPDCAAGWMLTAQQGDGGWGYDTTWPGSDPDMTAMALRALKILSKDTVVSLVYGERIAGAIDKGLGYLRSFQKSDGGFATLAYDENFMPVGPAGKSNRDTTVEVIQALVFLGSDPAAGEWRTGPNNANNPVNFLLSLQRDDGAFILDHETPNDDPLILDGAGKALLALTAFRNAFPNSSPGTWQQPGEAAPDQPQPDTITVNVKVRGPGGETMYNKTVRLSDSDKTALGALLATGADIELAFGGSYVRAIDGIGESGTAGWKYAVNGLVPGKSAASYSLSDGDNVVWFYAYSYRDSGGFREEGQLAPQPPQLTPEEQQQREEAAREAGRLLVRLQQESPTYLSETTGIERALLRMLVVGADNPMKADEKRYWSGFLADNKAEASARILPSQGGKVADKGEEVSLEVPQGSLKEAATITVREKENEGAADLFLPLNYKIISSLYEFDPSGLSFGKPATLVLRFILPEGVQAGDLMLASQDKDRKNWVPLPAVLDLANGKVLAPVSHFTRFAVLERRWSPKGFSDVDGQHFTWARDAVEMLAGKGVLDGVGEDRFAPERDVTRAEFAKMLAHALELKPQNSRFPFQDVSSTAWYAQDVSAVVAAGLFKGDAEGTFRPGAPMTREEMAAVLVRAAGIAPQEGVAATDLSFKDREAVSTWALPAVAAAVRDGLLQGKPGPLMDPQGKVSRAQAAVAVYRLLLKRNWGTLK